MNKLRTLLLICLAFLSASMYSQNIATYDFDSFEHRLKVENDSVYFINFWATWCVPCVKEMPAIQQIEEKYKDAPLKILLVSLDDPSRIETGLLPFIDKYNIKSEVVILDDPDFNSWIDKVDESWGGGIPASLIYSPKSRNFYEQSFHFKELDTIIKSKLEQL